MAYRVMNRTTEQVVQDVQEKFDLDIALFFIVSKTGTMRDGRFEFMGCDYRTLTAFEPAWCVEVRDLRTGRQVYRANIPR